MDVAPRDVAQLLQSTVHGQCRTLVDSILFVASSQSGVSLLNGDYEIS